MLAVRRPRTPEGFNRAAREARKRISAMVARGERPKSTDFDAVWSAFKHVLSQAQHGRCGYCDFLVIGGHDGTIDHYRPKAEVHTLQDDRSTWGRQTPDSASVQERKTQLLSEWGYHWLAYAWNNYVFACSCCNEKWKRALFPVAKHTRCNPPQPRGKEEPLLMSCYRALRPSEHLQFNRDGTVEALDGSLYGYETIRTVGLDRDPLCTARRDVTERVHALLKELAYGDSAQRDKAARDLRSMGDEKRPFFPGVVRAIVEQELERSWEEFVTSFCPPQGG